MSRWTPCKRGEFIRRLRKLGFDGPFSGTRHQFMIIAEKRLAIPSNAEYSVPELRMMIREVEAILRREIALDEWIDLSYGRWVQFALWVGRVYGKGRNGAKCHTFSPWPNFGDHFRPLTPLLSVN